MEIQDTHTPEISVIVPVYNVEKYIGRCIESILTQSFTDFELILVDDCTPDRSMDIVKEYASKDNRIKILSHSVNSGLALARKTGYEKANGNYFVFVDSDDYLAEEALQNLHTAITKENTDLVIAGYNSICNGTLIKECLPQTVDCSESHSLITATLQHKVLHTMWGKIFRKHLFFPAPPIERGLTLGEDAIAFGYIALQNPSVSFLQVAVYNYTENAESSTRKKFSGRQLQRLARARKILVDMYSPYPQLKSLILKNIIKSTAGLKLKKYRKRDFLDCYKNESLDFIFDFSEIRKHYSLHKAVLYWTILNFVSLRLVNKN